MWGPGLLGTRCPRKNWACGRWRHNSCPHRLLSEQTFRTRSFSCVFLQCKEDSPTDTEPNPQEAIREDELLSTYSVDAVPQAFIHVCVCVCVHMCCACVWVYVCLCCVCVCVCVAVTTGLPVCWASALALCTPSMMCLLILRATPKEVNTVLTSV